MDEQAGVHRVAGVLLRPVVQDLLAAVLVGVLGLVALWNPPAFVDFDFRAPDALGVALSLVAAASVTIRSSRPRSALLLSLAATLPLTVLGYSQSVGGLASLLALYSVAVGRPLRTSLPWLVAVLVTVGAALASAPLVSTPGDWLANLIVIAVTWMFGRTVRTRRAQHASVASRNEARIRARAAEARATVVEERAGVAREMQDLVAHNLTEVGVQVTAARRLLRNGDVTGADQLLHDAEVVSRSAIDEIRRAVAMLGHSDGDSALRPQPGIGELAELVQRHAITGSVVRLDSTGEPAEVSPGIALATYRLVEEALQLDGPGPLDADVDLDWRADTLSVRVATTPRHQLIAWDETDPREGDRIGRLRNRVQTYGGTLGCSRTRDGRIVVSAQFPLAVPGRTATWSAR